jgi:hypothetical protein
MTPNAAEWRRFRRKRDAIEIFFAADVLWPAAAPISAS